LALYNVTAYVNTIFVPDLEPTSFVSTYDTMYFILYYSSLLFCMYVFLLTYSVSNILLFMYLWNVYIKYNTMQETSPPYLFSTKDQW